MTADPARTSENADQTVTDPSVELVPVGGQLNRGDLIVRELMVLLAMGEWSAGAQATELAQKYGVSRGSVLDRVSEAGRFLRIQRTPDALFEFAMNRTLEIAGQDEVDRMAAVKVLFEQLATVEKRRGNRPQDKLTPEQEDARLDALLDDPPPRLLERLAAKGWRK